MKKKSKEAVSLGRKGGKALVKKYGREYMRKISKKANKKRWSNK